MVKHKDIISGQCFNDIVQKHVESPNVPDKKRKKSVFTSIPDLPLVSQVD